MRNSFIRTLMELADTDPRIFLITGDLGYSVLEPFALKHPDRFLNAGVAEQNMTGIAAGLSMTGRIAVTYSIGNFPILRCLEQVRNDACYHRLDVKIVSVGGGLAYGPLGYTHHCVEDLAILRALPGMTVFAPGDPVEVALCTRAMIERKGPCYLRLGKAGEPVLHAQAPSLDIGSPLKLRTGKDILLLSTGGSLALASGVSDLLSQHGVQAAVWSCPTVKPLAEAPLTQAAKTYSAIFTVEEHRAAGGFGSAVAEILCDAGCVPPVFGRFALGDDGFEEVGSQSHLCAKAGLEPAAMAQRILRLLQHQR